MYILNIITLIAIILSWILSAFNELNSFTWLLKDWIVPILFLVTVLITFIYSLTQAKKNKKDAIIFSVLTLVVWVLYSIALMFSLKPESGIFADFFLGNIPYLNTTGANFMWAITVSAVILSLVGFTNQKWVIGWVMTGVLFWWAKGVLPWNDVAGLVYFGILGLMMFLFWTFGEEWVVNIYFIILGVLFPISLVLTIAFPTIPVIADTVGMFLQIGIKSGLALLFLFASFIVGHGASGGEKKAFLFARACFLANGVIWFLELYLVGQIESLSPIMKQVATVINLPGFGILLAILGFVSYIITKVYQNK